MKRLAAIVILALAAAVVAVLGSGASSDKEQPGYRIDAIFDNVAFLIEGQEVRIAGAKIGSVDGFSLTPDHKARVEMSIDKRFAPFRADADCIIKPQSLLGDRYVQCTPGTPDAPPLQATGGHPPTVPVDQTHAPVDLDLVLGMLDVPVRQRLGILIGSLGAGLAGRGEDLNAAILHANPALQETRRVLDVVDRDRVALRNLIADSDKVISALGRRSDRVAAFLRHAGTVSATSGARRERLRELVRRLPGFLAEVRPAMERLTAFAKAGTPLMADLERSGPGTARLVRATGSFAEHVHPSLTRLRKTARIIRRALPDINPQLRRLSAFAGPARPAGDLLAQLATSLRDKGAIDGLGAFFYYGTSALARFDRNGHLLPNVPLVTPCILYATAPVAGCDGHFSSYTPLAPAARQRPSKDARPAAPDRARPPATAAPQLPHVQAPVPNVRVPDAVRKVLNGVGATPSDPPAQSSPTVRKLLDYLLR